MQYESGDGGSSALLRIGLSTFRARSLSHFQIFLTESQCGKKAKAYPHALQALWKADESDAGGAKRLRSGLRRLDNVGDVVPSNNSTTRNCFSGPVPSCSTRSLLSERFLKFAVR